MTSELKQAMGNLPKSSEIKSWTEWFERRAKYYDDPFMKMAYYIDKHPIPIEVMLATIEDAWKKLRATNECNLLDVGGGVGLFTQAFQSRLRHIITTDVSFTMVQDAHKLNPKGTFFVCEAAALPLVSCCFDRLICYSVFHYFSDLSHAREALIEFVRVVKNGGLMIIGDVPLHKQQGERKHTSEAKVERSIHYPASLEHNLKQLTYEPEFFIEFCTANGHNYEVLSQEIKGKLSSSSRFDVRIKVIK